MEEVGNQGCHDDVQKPCVAAAAAADYHTDCIFKDFRFILLFSISRARRGLLKRLCVR